MPMSMLRQAGAALGMALLGSCRDLAPIVVVIALFQVVILRQPFPEFFSIAMGLGLVVLGLALFVVGLDIGLFPFGRGPGRRVRPKRKSYMAAGVFLFAGVGNDGGRAGADRHHPRGGARRVGGRTHSHTQASIAGYALGVRLTVAVSVGAAIVIGVLRILRGWPLPYFILGGYGLVMLMTLFAPKEIIGLAYDLGGVTTSTVTVPLVTALGVGLARTIRGRDPLIDGFGLIALASLTPMIFVMVFGLVVH
jgi:hypothetical protein